MGGVGNVGVHNLSPGMVTTELLLSGAPPHLGPPRSPGGRRPPSRSTARAPSHDSKVAGHLLGGVQSYAGVCARGASAQGACAGVRAWVAACGRARPASRRPPACCGACAWGLPAVQLRAGREAR